MKIKLDEKAFMPVRAHEDDAGLDLRAPYPFTVGGCTPIGGPGKATIDTGVHVSIPEGYVGLLTSKSGLNVKANIVGTGTIDAGYTGSIKVKLYNLGPDPYHFEAGDKIIQLVILPILTPELEQVEELDETDRGGDGFGSTGK